MDFLRCALALALVAALCGCGAVTRRPDIDDVEVAAEAERMSQLVVERNRAMSKRLSDLSTPLLVGNADLCGLRTKNTISMVVHNLDDYYSNRRSIMADVYGLDDKVRVTLVGREGPAHIAGVREGDAVLAVNDIETPRGMSASAYFRVHMRPLVESGKPIKLTLLRGTERFTAIVQPVPACDYPVRLLANSTINAFATGSSIIMHTALLEAFPDDDMVGVVLAHELAHNVMGHRAKKVLRQIGDEFMGHLMYKLTGTRASADIYSDFSYLESSVDYEFEADYVAIYFAARAGLGYEKAPPFFRKLAMDHPVGINRSSTHPKYSERFVAMEAAIAEVRKKTGQGQPLIPEMKMDWDNERKPSMKDGVAPIAVGLGLGD